MRIIISERQYKLIQNNVSIDKILDKMISKEKLFIDEKKCLDAYSKYLSDGGDPKSFKCPELEYDEKEGEVFKSNLPNIPEITFTFSEEINMGNEIQYFGEIKFEGEEYLGLIITDNRGYLTGFDFYNVSDEENDYSFQEKIEGLEHEVEVFFEEIIESLRN